MQRLEAAGVLSRHGAVGDGRGRRSGTAHRATVSRFHISCEDMSLRETRAGTYLSRVAQSTASGLIGCSESNTYVLVHGAFSDSNAWQRIPPRLTSLQKRLDTESPVERVLPVESGHWPFFTQPEELARHLPSL